jgi:NTP pyrophosphatase (non-canonical NTP hydrolase)
MQARKGNILACDGGNAVSLHAVAHHGRPRRLLERRVVANAPDPGGPVTDRFTSPAPLPSDRQRELLIVLMEECAEVAQRASKAARFGMDEVQPGQPDTNLIRIAREMGDLTGTLRALLDTVRPDLAETFHSAVIDAERAKSGKLARFLQST